jgi:hypothetical protein
MRSELPLGNSLCTDTRCRALRCGTGSAIVLHDCRYTRYVRFLLTTTNGQRELSNQGPSDNDFRSGSLSAGADRVVARFWQRLERSIILN